MPNFNTFTQGSTGIPSHRNWEEVKSIRIGKAKVRLSLFAYDRIL
jgi:hypothetical protein